MTDEHVHVVRVGLGERAYNVLIGAGLLNECGHHIAEVFGTVGVAIVTDTHVAAHHLETVTASLAAAGITCRTVIDVQPGEASKCFATLTDVTSKLLASGLERRDVVIALGGGVIGDLAGFAAAIIRRGVAFVQIPTSLLAQVDSSVGGKTGINTAEGKNLVGAFHQPGLVLADIATLDTLPDRELRAGYAEVVKYGLLGDRTFFDWLDDNRAPLFARDREALAHAVRRSVEMKAEIVARDEREAGDRALLNLGHTFGHALEAWAGYSDRLLHGEAVAIGMALAFGYSERIGRAPPQTTARVSAHLKSVGLPTRVQDIPGPDAPSLDRLMTLMSQDKKVVGGRLTLILADDIGAAYITRDVDHDDVATYLSECLTPSDAAS